MSTRQSAQRIVIVSDIHGNLEALSALTEDYDELWVLGDLVNYGPNPSEVVGFVRERASLVISGNHDYAIGYSQDARCSGPFKEMASAMQFYTEASLSTADREYLTALPQTVDRVVGRTRFFLCHAAPSDPLYKYIPSDSPEWETEVEAIDCDVLLTGHTHVQFKRSVGSVVVANPGSLGQPKSGAPRASYAVWDGKLELRTYPYPVERTVEKIRRLPIATHVRENLEQVLLTGTPGTA